jgi:hypothetical protein
LASVIYRYKPDIVATRIVITRVYCIALRDQAREALAGQTDTSGTMDSHLHAVSGASSYHSNSETKMNPRKKIESRLITRRDKPLL